MKENYSRTFVCLAAVSVVCLIVSNLFATKIFALGPFALPAAVIIFPVSYILNDCFTEVWGFRKAMFVVWLGFALNILVVLFGQLAVMLPGASFWEGAEHFNFVFKMAPRVALASILAFLAGSFVNSKVMSRMKVAEGGRRFGVRAIVSSLAGEFADSLVFMPLAFWGTPVEALGKMMLVQVSFKVLYEIIILPCTSAAVKALKRHEGVDTFDVK
ncbi:MAG: queuosine precursor transporter [Bacteroidales bacterium]|nr:queuosine precursor transporter [Bacteroidales bacterium]